MELKIGRFSEKGRQLQSILMALIEDEAFVKLVHNADKTPLETALPNSFDPQSLINTKLYTQVYEPPTDKEVVNVCVYYKRGGIGEGRNKTTFYKNSDIGISIIVHRDLWDIEGGLRAFEIADRVDYILNRKSVTGSLSNEWFKKFQYYPVNNSYSVLELFYSNWD